MFIVSGLVGPAKPAGANGQVQYNNNGVFGASDGFTFDGVNHVGIATGALGEDSGVLTIGGTHSGIGGFIETNGGAGLTLAAGNNGPVQFSTAMQGLTIFGTKSDIDFDGALNASGPNAFAVIEGSIGSGGSPQGVAVLVGGTVDVAYTGMLANSRVFLTVNTPGGTVGTPYVSARNAGVGFTIASTLGTDTSTVAYEVFQSTET